ncbi:MAG TPA: ElyC/SanA/YdcF family protein [Bryobacteraceae bacterium]|jgi:hypothetical protein
MDRTSLQQHPGSSLRRKGLWVAGGLILVALGLGLAALHNLGQWLEVDETLQHAAAIVVFGGGVPFRAMEAAGLYRDGWAREVWLTHTSPNDNDRAMDSLGIPFVREYEYSRQVLEKLGVPPSAIRMVPDAVDNTEAEVRAVIHYEQACGVQGPVILVSSKYHSRRIRVIWNAVVKDRRVAVVRYAAMEKFNAGRWWSTTTDATATCREGFGILNAWAGFPISPRER